MPFIITSYKPEEDRGKEIKKHLIKLKLNKDLNLNYHKKCESLESLYEQMNNVKCCSQDDNNEIEIMESENSPSSPSL